MSCHASAAPLPRTGVANVARRLSHLALRVELALQVRRERRMLMRLDDHALQDVGFDQGRAYGEASRSFWDVPVDRLRR